MRRIASYLQAGTEKGPGIPDGTGPLKDTEECPFNKDKEASEWEHIKGKFEQFGPKVKDYVKKRFKGYKTITKRNVPGTGLVYYFKDDNGNNIAMYQQNERVLDVKKASNDFKKNAEVGPKSTKALTELHSELRKIQLPNHYIAAEFLRSIRIMVNQLSKGKQNAALNAAKALVILVNDKKLNY